MVSTEQSGKGLHVEANQMPEENKGAEHPQSRHGRSLATVDKLGLKN